MAYFLDNFPVSDDCAELVLTEEQEKYCRVVYKLDGEGGACFDSLWDPETKYSDEHVIVPLRSTGCSVVSFDPSLMLEPAKCFANVIGSSKDPLILDKWWIDLWSEKCNSGVRPNFCSSDGNFYAVINNKEKTLDSVLYPRRDPSTNKWIYPKSTPDCGGSSVGGHVLISTKKASTASRGSNSVHILPICEKHNIAVTKKEDEFGTGYYMKLGQKVKALKLVNYLNRVSEYLERAENEIRHE